MRKYVLCMLFLLLLAACQSAPQQAERPTPEPTPTSFTLNGTDITFFNPGEHFDLKVRLVPEDAEAEVTWTSSDPDIASVSWNGRVTAISGGTVTITATIEGVGEQECVVRCQFADSANPAATVTPTPEPTPEPTAVGIEVDIGDGEHKFWVELVDTGEPAADSNKLLVNIYRDETGKELLQTFGSWWADPYGLYCFPVEDMDFDGDMDFAVCNIEYRSNHQKSHYIWDGEQERFVEDPYGLNDLCNTRFDEERQVVRTNQGSVTGETTEYYQYRQGSLVCIRSLYRQYWSEDNTMHLKVEDEVDGVLITVYEEKIPFGELPKGELWTEEFERWENPDYHGE